MWWWECMFFHFESAHRAELTAHAPPPPHARAFCQIPPLPLRKGGLVCACAAVVVSSPPPSRSCPISPVVPRAAVKRKDEPAPSRTRRTDCPQDTTDPKNRGEWTSAWWTNVFAPSVVCWDKEAAAVWNAVFLFLFPSQLLLSEQLS